MGLVDPADGIGYLQLTGFQKTSAEEIDQAVELPCASQGMRVLVLDLRGNPGGLLNVAVEIAERFIDSGLIVSTRGRAQGQTQSLSANGRARWRMPLYVLVDHDSASASEILAGALQDHQRATILGARTYGKGSVQSIFSLRSAPAGLKLTTAKFYSPRNRPYSEQGVQPDIPITVRSAAKPDRRRCRSPRGSDLRRPATRPRPGGSDPHRQEPDPGGPLRERGERFKALRPALSNESAQPVLPRSVIVQTIDTDLVDPLRHLVVHYFEYSVVGSIARNTIVETPATW